MGEVQSYYGRSHGKIILIGEHSVVHFQPAIALPLMETAMTSQVVPRDDGRIMLDCEYFTGWLKDVPASLMNVRELITKFLHDSSCISQGLTITVSSTIPAERGMGSSAAVAISVLRAVSAFVGKTLSFQEEFDYAQISENIAHSNASGMDTATVASDSAVWFQRGEGISTLTFDTSGVLVVADTGIKGGTREAVSDVNALLNSTERSVSRITAARIERLGTLTEQSAHALRSDDLDRLGDILDESHAILSAMTVSHPSLDTLVTAARSAGALGAKLTGGGRGGCMIAVARDVHEAERVRDELVDAGACRTWNLPLVSRGMSEV